MAKTTGNIFFNYKNYLLIVYKEFFDFPIESKGILINPIPIFKNSKP